MYNKVILVGRLGKDPEVNYTQNGTAVSNFSLATDDFWRGGDGDSNKVTDWHKCTAWGRLADVAAEYISKGDKILVEGKLKNNSYVKEGVTIHYTYVHITSMKFIDVKGSLNTPDDLEISTGDMFRKEVPF